MKYFTKSFNYLTKYQQQKSKNAVRKKIQNGIIVKIKSKGSLSSSNKWLKTELFIKPKLGVSFFLTIRRIESLKNRNDTKPGNGRS
jgi:hypothetical protein